MNNMDSVRKRFVLLAALSVFALLLALLTIINGVNFTMAASDADHVTEMLAERRGMFQRGSVPPDEAGAAPPPFTENSADTGMTDTGMTDTGMILETESSKEPPQTATAGSEDIPTPEIADSLETPGTGNGQTKRKPEDSRRGRGPRFGPMGPDSPELAATTRYFTYAFDHDGNAEQIAFALSAVEPEDAESWADSLRVRQQTGWTRTTYRYRVYHAGGRDYVTVIDQGRELLPSLRILTISIVGGLLGVAVSYLILLSVSRRLFRPLEDADRKQKRFIADVERDFKVPLTVIDTDVEILERESGENERTQSVHRQVKRMVSLLRDLSSLSLFDEEDLDSRDMDFTGFARAAADSWREQFTEKGMTLAAEIQDGVTVRGDGQAMADMLEELLRNAWKFGKTAAFLTVRQNGSRVEVLMSNDTDLPERSVEQVFDRFTRLENANGVPGAGLGLSRVREIVRAHNGRLTAKSAGGSFTLTVHL
ncbi:MAG: HAMP domain-containing histidine kinase [Abditibacteriota bacterium]|nr:HAMP domain-containing histidine kinase [Abditibacteriota bacterium]